MNCPVCNKAGLPDYNLTPIKCPQCNSDLSGYVLINKERKRFYKTIHRQKLLYGLVGFLTILLGLTMIYLPHNYQNQTELQVKDSTIVNLKSEIELKNIEISKLKKSIKKPSQAEFKYIIKEGDNLSKIAFLFFNDAQLYKLIAAENGIKSTDLIFPGDTLKITLKFNKRK